MWKIVLGGVVLPIVFALFGFWSFRRIRPEPPAGEAVLFLKSCTCPACGFAPRGEPRAR